MTASSRTNLSLVLAAVAMVAIASTAHAQITIVNQVEGWMGINGNRTIITTIENAALIDTLQYDATGVDKLVFAVGSEAGFNNQIMTMTGVTFNGTALTQAVQNNFAPLNPAPPPTTTTDGGTASIWYLDNPAQVTGELNVSYTTTGGQPNNGLATIFGLADTLPGVGNVGDTWTSQGAAGNVSTSLTTSADNSLVIAMVENSGSNNGAGTPSAVGPLTQSNNGEWGNQWGSYATGYQSVASSGTLVNPTFSTNPGGSIHVVAAEFLAMAAGPAPIPDMFAMGRNGDTSTLLGVTETPFSVATIGSSNLGRFNGIDFDPVTGVLYASTNNGPNPDSLFTIDPTSGAATVVGPLSANVRDLAFGSDGTLYGSDFDTLRQINTTTGEATPIGSFVNSGDIESIAFDSTTDTLYGLDWNDGDLWEINTVTGEATGLGSYGSFGAGDITGFGIDSAGNFFASIGGGVGEIWALEDPLLGFSSSLVGDAFNGSVSDIAFQSAAVPEPASIAIWSLIGLGLAGFGYYRVRRKK